MTSEVEEQEIIIRTERGLSIAGTRITIYDVMYYLKAEYPRRFIRDAFMLTDEQIDGALSYIKSHAIEVEEEYKEILREAEETRQYWEERNREHFARIAAKPPRSGHEAARIKIIKQRMEREAKKK